MPINVNGVLLFNKPPILSSNVALQKIKKIYNASKAGHTGTLDPLATGLLPICFGEATKFSRFLLDADKEYIATIKLGETTTTYDAEGEILERKEVLVNNQDIKLAIQGFLGKISQIPPIYSALKVNGKHLYQYARNNQEVAIQSREITITEIEIISWSRDLSDLSIAKMVEGLNILGNESFLSNTDKTFKIRVLCSKGTYIRTLAHDIGIKLGCGAHLIGLIRTKTGGFDLDKDVNLDNLLQMLPEELHKLLLPVDVLVSELARLDLNDEEFSYIKDGRAINNTYNIHETKLLKLYYKDRFLGVAQALNNEIKSERLMNLS